MCVSFDHTGFPRASFESHTCCCRIEAKKKIFCFPFCKRVFDRGFSSLRIWVFVGLKKIKNLCNKENILYWLPFTRRDKKMAFYWFNRIIFFIWLAAFIILLSFIIYFKFSVLTLEQTFLVYIIHGKRNWRCFSWDENPLLLLQSRIKILKLCAAVCDLTPVYFEMVFSWKLNGKQRESFSNFRNRSRYQYEMLTKRKKKNFDYYPQGP